MLLGKTSREEETKKTKHEAIVFYWHSENIAKVSQKFCTGNPATDKKALWVRESGSEKRLPLISVDEESCQRRKAHIL